MECPADEVNSTTRMAPSMHSKRGPLRRTPVSVFFPDGPEIVHCEVEDVREDSAFRFPQLKAFGCRGWGLLVWALTAWPCAGPARTAGEQQEAYSSHSDTCFHGRWISNRRIMLQRVTLGYSRCVGDT